ncbi:MAG: ankyrin repeat domain-containing protein [Bryobacteraceae bacterium]|nr:ankyrin repeat domain-containing protein [Bryobacteraceae bacterium]
MTVSEFLRAVGDGDLPRVREGLFLVNELGPHPFWGGRPQALHVAIETRRLDVFRLLLEAGADVNGRNEEYADWSPLMLAAQRGEHEMHAELLRRGAVVGLGEALLMGNDARVAECPLPPKGEPWLNLARTPKSIDLLVAKGASLTAADRWGQTPVTALSQLGASGLPLVRRLIDHGASAGPEVYARLGERAALAQMDLNDDVFIAAVEYRHADLVDWLLSQGATPNARASDRSRQTALHAAAWNGDLAMAQRLISAGADPRATDEEHRSTPQEWAEVAERAANRPECRAVAAYLAGLTGR